MPGPRLPRYPRLLEQRPSRPPAGRCQACGGVINRERRGSQFDLICNRLINPHGLGDSGTIGEIVRTPRPDPPGWEERLALVRGLHQDLRGDRPGWGRISVNVLEGEIAQRIVAWQLRGRV